MIGLVLLTCVNIFCAYKKINQIPSGHAGCDMRFNDISDLDKDLLKNITINYEKSQLLKYLENKKISLVDKIRIIDRLDIDLFEKKYTPDMLAGGLYNDWMFEF